MLVHEQNPKTDLTLFIKRAKITNDKELSVIPDPVYDPKHEQNIDKATAISYEVKKGDFIQIIDLYGRQCSDFNAFDSESLQKGKEYSIDPTATRSLIGNSYPMPGLSSKFFDRNQDPLIEVLYQ